MHFYSLYPNFTKEVTRNLYRVDDSALVKDPEGQWFESQAEHVNVSFFGFNLPE